MLDIPVTCSMADSPDNRYVKTWPILADIKEELLLLMKDLAPIFSQVVKANCFISRFQHSSSSSTLIIIAKRNIT